MIKLHRFSLNLFLFYKNKNINLIYLLKEYNDVPDYIEYLADILTVGDLEERVAVVDELMKDDKITFLQDYTARKKKEVAQHGEEPENA